MAEEPVEIGERHRNAWPLRSRNLLRHENLLEGRLPDHLLQEELGLSFDADQSSAADGDRLQQFGANANQVGGNDKTDRRALRKRRRHETKP
jgi:hypothetical protein